MTVMVDELQEYPEHMIAGGARRHGSKWCHLASDYSFDELHVFADRLGLRREWFQGDHYDLTPGMRAKAIKLGAQEAEARWLVQCMAKR